MKRILFGILVLSGCRGPEETGIEIFPDMVHSQAVEAFSESKIDPGQSSMKLPVKNSIPRGKMPFLYGKGDKEAMRAGEELKNPWAYNNGNLEVGRSGYESYCLVCHGIQGKGDGPLIPKFPNPPSFTSKRVKKYKDGRLFHIITKGAGDMPEHASQITEKDRWLIVHYIKELQGRNKNEK